MRMRQKEKHDSASTLASSEVRFDAIQDSGDNGHRLRKAPSFLRHPD
jgi:hypothetical protein